MISGECSMLHKAAKACSQQVTYHLSIHSPIAEFIETGLPKEDTHLCDPWIIVDLKENRSLFFLRIVVLIQV